jgi:quercetin dioxygenase-like cupin family protein
MPDAMKAEFAACAGDGRVGQVLLSETARVRVWSIRLQPGDRLGFHTHVLDYFWTSVTAGHGRSHFDDGEVADIVYQAGDIKQLAFAAGEFMIHDLENVGDTELLFTTVEFLDSANAPLVLRGQTR